MLLIPASRAICATHRIASADGTATGEELEFFIEAINWEIAGVDTKIRLHTCWGNPNQQPLQRDDVSVCLEPIRQRALVRRPLPVPSSHSSSSPP